VPKKKMVAVRVYLGNLSFAAKCFFYSIIISLYNDALRTSVLFWRSEKSM